ncbi:tagatose 1,6-diphosphate aldolase [Rhodobacteraceae bacterium 2CG4]|uniref:Tagatose 1,6-diphosphate aldolase n=1 Tax=Halovulum marinum TaxID=2662447 RepID=A0A6L5Z3T0_9RHOB|nr:tagatose 1,6-diphosphate aldolase [Halovulum marinum]MSU91223.1 tagatose 1,6-diphosphate aldolase [Halovulum marinum]
MTEMPLTQRRPIRGVAVDQGSGLGAALRAARGAAAQDDDLFRFKQLVARTMSAEATTVLVDAQYGRDLLPAIAAGCVPMLAYEADVYKISNQDRITVLPDDLKIADYPGLGVGMLKFFLYYGPDDDAAINERKHALVRRIGAECREHGVGFLFEPIVYDRAVPDGASAAFAVRKPELVERATRRFADPAFDIDILKVEFPVNLNFVEGQGEPAMSTAEAEAAFARAAAAAGDIPLLYLSAGVTFAQFEAGLKLARAAGVDMAGFMCGRAIWSDAVAVFGAEGPAAAERWMEAEGLHRLRRLAAALA